MTHKQIQRAEIRKRISSLSEDYCRKSDASISAKILSLDAYQKASYIFCYINMEKEPDTRPIIESAWNSGKHVAVPRCTGPGQMSLFQIHSYADLKPGSYRIPEPIPSCREIDPSEIDFAIIPCVSCDRSCNRLGHGGGYYDRYLENTKTICAALCREALLLDQVSLETYDQPVTMVITEKQIYFRNSSSFTQQ